MATHPTGSPDVYFKELTIKELIMKEQPDNQITRNDILTASIITAELIANRQVYLTEDGDLNYYKIDEAYDWIRASLIGIKQKQRRPPTGLTRG